MYNAINAYQNTFLKTVHCIYPM